jgi:hypothetical protein
MAVTHEVRASCSDLARLLGLQSVDGSTERKLAWCAAAAVAALVFVAFAPALSAHFVNWDDLANLDDLRESGGLRREPLRWFYTTGHVDPYQPVSWLSLAVDMELWGLEPGLDAPQAPRFHLTSLAIHAFAAVAFLFVARRLLAIALPRAAEPELTLAAAFAACVFAIHPLRCESVAWVTERRDVLSGAFYLLAAGAWFRATPKEPPRIASVQAAIRRRRSFCSSHRSSSRTHRRCAGERRDRPD